MGIRYNPLAAFASEMTGRRGAVLAPDDDAVPIAAEAEVVLDPAAVAAVVEPRAAEAIDPGLIPTTELELGAAPAREIPDPEPDPDTGPELEPEPEPEAEAEVDA